MSHCEHCQFFEIVMVQGPTPGDRLIGHCHRLPPTAGKPTPLKPEAERAEMSHFHGEGERLVRRVPANHDPRATDERAHQEPTTDSRHAAGRLVSRGCKDVVHFRKDALHPFREGRPAESDDRFSCVLPPGDPAGMADSARTWTCCRLMAVTNARSMGEDRK